MTFVLGIYSFNLNITNPDSEGYFRLRIQIPRHPEESLQHLYVRVLAYSLAYEEGLQFTVDPFDAKLPSIAKKDLLGDVTVAIDVGEIDPEKIRRSLKRRPPPHHKVYFYDEAQIARFCHEMRGSTTNWIADIEFFSISFDFLTSITEFEKTSSSWEITLVDSTLYLSVDGHALSTEILRVDMWQRFQESLTLSK